MLSAICKRIAKSPATAIATLALILAMTGGAYAANKLLITSTKQISPKVLKALKGANGKNGSAGPAGAQGPQGLPGPAGAKGETGAAGVGSEGKEGKEGKTGKEGKEGKEGKTGFTSTLPAGSTETGTFAGTLYHGEEGSELEVSISFPIPLSKSGEAFVFNKEATDGGNKGDEGGCAGSAEEPTAPPGVLCVYTAEEENVNFSHFPGASFNGSFGFQPFGAVIHYFGETAPARIQVNGSWAVTAPLS